jgi:hypothetical protein
VTVTTPTPGPTETGCLRADMLDVKVGQAKKDDPEAMTRVGFDAMKRGDGDVVSGLKKNVTPAGVVAERHRRMAEPGSAKKASK